MSSRDAPPYAYADTELSNFWWFRLDGDHITFHRIDEEFQLPLPPDGWHWRCSVGSLHLETNDSREHWFMRWDLPGGELHAGADTTIARFFFDAVSRYWKPPVSADSDRSPAR